MYINSMAKKRIKRPRDPVQLAKLMGDILTGQTQDEIEDGKNPKSVEAGRRGGLKGGQARAEALTDSERKEIAKKAAETRWRDDKEIDN